MQARLTFQNLKMAVEAAGSDLSCVAQVLVTLVDVDDVPTVDRVYREFFADSYPNRSTVIAKGSSCRGCASRSSHMSRCRLTDPALVEFVFAHAAQK